MNVMAAIEPPSLPANVETEAALLGCLMNHNAAIDQVADRLRTDHFFEPIHGRIFDALMRERSLGRSATPVTLRPYFVDDEPMREVGGPAYLAQLTGTGAEVVGIKDFVEQVLELARRRRLIVGLEEARKLAADYNKGSDEIAANVEAVLADVQEEAAASIKEMSAAETITAHLNAIEEGLPPGVFSNIGPLDHAMGPIRPGDLQIIAGRPGMGKSILGMSIAKGAALDGHGVLFVSLEMKAEQLGMRLAADLCFNGHDGINFQNIERGELSPEQFRRIVRARDAIENLPLTVTHLPSLRIGRLNTLIRRHARRFAARGQKLELVVVDYLQLLDADRQSDNRTAEVSQISRGLKSAALANDLGIIAFAQLSRKVEERDEKRPRLSDLRESGAIEQDADGVLFLYRPEYYLLQNEPPEGHERRDKWEGLLKACQGDIEFICAKRRQGETGIRHGRFYGAFMTVRA